MTRTLTVDIKIVGLIDDLIIAVTRYVPHGYLVARLDLLTSKFIVFLYRSAHIGQRGLVTNNLWYCFWNKVMVRFQLGELVWELIHEVNPTRDGIPGGVIATNDQQDQVTEVLQRVHFLHVFVVCHHRDEIKAITWVLLCTIAPEFHEDFQALP